jgi:hypothetical protein
MASIGGLTVQVEGILGLVSTIEGDLGRVLEGLEELRGNGTTSPSLSGAVSVSPPASPKPRRRGGGRKPDPAFLAQVSKFAGENGAHVDQITDKLREKDAQLAKGPRSALRTRVKKALEHVQ